MKGENNNHLPAVILARLSWVAITILVAVYIGYASIHGTNAENAMSGGLNACFTCPNGWNWHVLLSTLAFGIFMAEGLIAFAAPSRALGSRGIQMWWHLLMQTSALIMTWIGLAAIVATKVAQGYNSLYSVHSWCGVVVLAMFTLQYSFGLFAFFIFKRNLGKSETYRWWHSFFGFLTFFAGVETCVNGWADMQMMNVDYGQPAYGSATMVGNGSILALWLLAASLFYIMVANLKPAHRQIPLEFTKGQEEDV